MPQLPDALRQDELHLLALLRFHVAPDGSASVELLNPTPNLALNRVLLATFRTWKFIPAMQDGKPSASQEDLSVRVDVQ